MNCQCGNIAERSGKCATCSRAERKASKTHTGTVSFKKRPLNEFDKELIKDYRRKLVVKEIRKVSPKMAKALTEYTKKRKYFLLHCPSCKVCGGPASEVHHQKGRSSVDLLLDTQFWIAVCHRCHVEIEYRPQWAKERGFSLDRLTKTTNQ